MSQIRRPTPTYPRPRLRSRPHATPAPADDAPTALSTPVAVTFHFDGTPTPAAAAPGTNIMELASSVGVDIPAGCYSGSCGLCECELLADGSAEASVVRACVAVVPAGVGKVRIDPLPDDAAWGQDGWDT